ncbi:MAG: transglutaminase domain-containing protein [Chloroflexi bacterium]|nr:transglutaminase domain-containing protein [Chloroflexota bacterium]
MRWWDWVTAFSLMILLITSSTRLYATHWTNYLERIQYLAFLGGLIGLALGQSRFSPRLVKWLAFGYTLFAIPWQLGETAGVGVPWDQRLNSLITRISIATNEVFHYQSVQDPILFLFLMALLFWLVSLISGYFLTRYGKPWQAILPAGIIMIVISHYDPGLAISGNYLAIYVFFSLLLLGRVTFLRYRAEWRAAGMVPSPGASLDIGRAALVSVVVLVMLAWTVPALAASLPPASEIWVEISKPWDNLSHRFSDAFSGLRTSIGTVSDFYGTSMPLGSGSRLGDGIVFTVKASAAPAPGVRYYWQARTYDDYQNGNWSTTVTSSQPVTPDNFDVKYPAWSGREKVTFTFTSSVTLLSTIYTPPIPLWVSRPGQAVETTAADGTNDLTTLTAVPPLHAGETYTVDGWVSDPTVSELRSSGTNYPSWVLDSYLQIPNNFPSDIGALARKITQGMNNPYDKTEAITQYLRQTITYSQIIPTPPAGQEPLQWFLFDLKQGYCNYYASAEVMMLRTLGIPARLAVGFAQGDPGSVSNTYIVRYKDSHAWPEVYFEGYGWVEFEPTVSQPARQLLLGNGSSTDNSQPESDILHGSGGAVGGGDYNPQITPSTFTLASLIGRIKISPEVAALLSVLLVVLLGFLAWRYARRRYHVPEFPIWLETNLTRRGVNPPRWLKRWSQHAAYPPLVRAYGVFNRVLRLMGNPPKPSDTPTERASNLTRLLPAAAEPAETLLGEYQTAQYSTSSGNPSRAYQASRQVRNIAYGAYLGRIFTQVKRRIAILFGR